MPDLSDYLTTKEAASELGYHVNHIRRMVRLGYLKGLKVGNTLLIAKVSLKAFTEGAKAYQKHDPRKTAIKQN